MVVFDMVAFGIIAARAAVIGNRERDLRASRSPAFRDLPGHHAIFSPIWERGRTGLTAPGHLFSALDEHDYVLWRWRRHCVDSGGPLPFASRLPTYPRVD